MGLWETFSCNSFFLKEGLLYLCPFVNLSEYVSWVSFIRIIILFMKYAAAITLYNPKSEDVDNLLVYAECFPLVIVNDNSMDNATYSGRIKGIPTIHYLWNGRNWGLPAAFNRSLKIAESLCVDFLCTLDQDSRLSAEAIMSIRQFIESADVQNVAIIAPSPIGPVSSFPSVDITQMTEECHVICSGSFVNVNLLKEKAITYDEAYFVDSFDTDFSKQICRAKLKQIRLTGVQMPHGWGDGSGHSPLRHYYIFRNRLYFNDKYYKKVISLFRSTLQTIRHCGRLLVNEEDAFFKIRMLFLAIRDYRNGKMGEVSDKTLNRIIMMEAKLQSS